MIIALLERYQEVLLNLHHILVTNQSSNLMHESRLEEARKPCGFVGRLQYFQSD